MKKFLRLWLMIASMVSIIMILADTIFNQNLSSRTVQITIACVFFSTFISTLFQFFFLEKIQSSLLRHLLTLIVILFAIYIAFVIIGFDWTDFLISCGFAVVSYIPVYLYIYWLVIRDTNELNKQLQQAKKRENE